MEIAGDNVDQAIRTLLIGVGGLTFGLAVVLLFWRVATQRLDDFILYISYIIVGGLVVVRAFDPRPFNPESYHILWGGVVALGLGSIAFALKLWRIR